MELRDQEGFNNNYNDHPKPENSLSNKKYHEERSPIFNLNVPLSEENLAQFINSFEKTKSFEVQFGFLNALLKASPQLLEKFADSKGATLLSKILHESARDLNAKMEIIDRILIFFTKIELTTDTLTRTRIHQEVDELSEKTFKMLIKWRPVIEQWQNEAPSIEEIRKNVQWNEDMSLVKGKDFRFNDEPSHRALFTEDEVAQIQEKLSNDLKISPNSLSSEDIKHKESQMEGNSFKIRKDNEKEFQSKLNAMAEPISWYRPRKIVIHSEPIQYGINSYEAKEHEKRIATKLPCFYWKDSQIPDHPSFDFIKNQRKTTSTPLEIPLVTSNADAELEEARGLDEEKQRE